MTVHSVPETVCILPTGGNIHTSRQHKRLLTRKFKCYQPPPPPRPLLVSADAFCPWLSLQKEVGGEWPKSSSLETSLGSLAKMSCVAYSHVSFQGRGQILSGNILTDVTLFQTHTSTNVHKFKAKRKGVGWGGDSSPEEKRSAFCQRHPNTLRLEHRAKP